MTRPTFEQQCERDQQAALRMGKMFDAVIDQLLAPKSNVVKFPQGAGPVKAAPSNK